MLWQVIVILLVGAVLNEQDSTVRPENDISRSYDETLFGRPCRLKHALRDFQVLEKCQEEGRTAVALKPVIHGKPGVLVNALTRGHLPPWLRVDAIVGCFTLEYPPVNLKFLEHTQFFECNDQNQLLGLEGPMPRSLGISRVRERFHNSSELLCNDCDHGLPQCFGYSFINGNNHSDLTFYVHEKYNNATCKLMIGQVYVSAADDIPAGLKSITHIRDGVLFIVNCKMKELVLSLVEIAVEECQFGLVVAGNANLESLRIPNLSLVDQSKCHEMSKGKITIYANPKLKRENVILHEYMKDVVFFDESEKFDESLKPQRQPIDRRSSDKYRGYVIFCMSFAVLVSLAAIIIDQLYRLLTVENKWIAVPYKPDLLVFDPNTSYSKTSSKSHVKARADSKLPPNTKQPQQSQTLTKSSDEDNHKPKPAATSHAASPPKPRSNERKSNETKTKQSNSIESGRQPRKKLEEAPPPLAFDKTISKSEKEAMPLAKQAMNKMHSAVVRNRGSGENSRNRGENSRNRGENNRKRDNSSGENDEKRRRDQPMSKANTRSDEELPNKDEAPPPPVPIVRTVIRPSPPRVPTPGVVKSGRRRERSGKEMSLSNTVPSDETTAAVAKKTGADAKAKK